MNYSTDKSLSSSKISYISLFKSILYNVWLLDEFSNTSRLDLSATFYIETNKNYTSKFKMD
jgi:hypothetical protein